MDIGYSRFKKMSVWGKILAKHTNLPNLIRFGPKMIHSVQKKICENYINMRDLKETLLVGFIQFILSA